MSALTVDADAVRAFLAERPDFLTGEPALLEQLELAHRTAAGSSLIEHQVVQLRQRVASLEGQIADYHASAAANEAVFRRVHELYLEMILAPTPAALLALLHTRLAERFGCDFVVIGQTDGRPPATGPGPTPGSEELVDLSGARDAVAPILEAGEPVCGRLSAERLAQLFAAEAAAAVRSAAVVPWGVPAAGVLVLGSRDERKFFPGMGTLFLAFLGQMFGQRWLALTGGPAAAADGPA